MILMEVPSRKYQDGFRDFGAITIPDNVTRLRVTFTRESWPLTGNDPLIRITLEGTLDSGATWPIYASAQCNGGTEPNVFGGQFSNLSTDVPLAPGQVRRIRSSAEILAALDTAITVEGW